jgi:hypothetical protein
MLKSSNDDRPGTQSRNRQYIRSEAGDWSKHRPPDPSQMLTSMGVFLLVALCFGLAAELLLHFAPH